jgi:leucyl-tRNA synthetase
MAPNTSSYNHKQIEEKWQEIWYENNIYRAVDFSPKPKKYILFEFPYPSGEGLHCGHVYRFTLPDVYARKLRMSGYNVLFPIGWDAFGLPAENYAVKTGINPAITTERIVAQFKQELKSLGYSFDWEREINTTDPSYYKWTQWIFLKLFEAGLAELREEPVWWCEELKTVLANEEVLDDENGNKISERGGHPVIKRPLKQWILKIPEYADKLLKGLDEIDFPESVKIAQRDWIGKSIGADIFFPLNNRNRDQQISVFTTRPDTIFGVTYLTIAPEHHLLELLKGEIRNWEEVKSYIDKVKNRSERERLANKEKSGVKIEGITAKHPFNEQELPIFVADYVLASYGTGAVMAVPAHDERDYLFAEVFNLPIIKTVGRKDSKEDKLPYTSKDCFVLLTEEVRKFLSIEKLDNLTMEDRTVKSVEFTTIVIEALKKRNLGGEKIQFKMRDWIFSRQRYWGEPIPLVHTKSGEIKALANTKDKDKLNQALPLKLPVVQDYLPSSTGESPLAKEKNWVNFNFEGEEVERETNTMPNWAGSCWYFLRYTDPKNSEEFASKELLNYWLPVDRYFGGSEHTTLHLLYSRFWHRFLYDIGEVPCSEPFSWRLNGGLLLGPDNRKMSKSVGNVISPESKISEFGADALRLYICFMGPYDSTLPWSESGLKACRKLLERILVLREKVLINGVISEKGLKALHKGTKKISHMLDSLKANTAVAELMILVRAFEQESEIDSASWRHFLKLLAPLAPFISEELWQREKSEEDGDSEFKSIHLEPWPLYDETLATDDLITVGVQVNGKLRESIELALNEEAELVQEKALALENVAKWIEGKEIRKFIYVPNKIINFVV